MGAQPALEWEPKFFSVMETAGSLRKEQEEKTLNCELATTPTSIFIHG